MTWNYFARAIAFQYGFWLSDQEVHDVLWEATAFPMGGIQYTGKQLHELFRFWRSRDRRGYLPDPNESLSFVERMSRLATADCEQRARRG